MRFAESLDHAPAAALHAVAQAGGNDQQTAHGGQIIALFISGIGIHAGDQGDNGRQAEQKVQTLGKFNGFGAAAAPGDVFHLPVNVFEADDDADDQAEPHGKTMGRQVADGIEETADIAAAGQGGADAHEQTGDQALAHFKDRRHAEGKVVAQAGGDKGPGHEADADDGS